MDKRCAYWKNPKNQLKYPSAYKKYKRIQFWKSRKNRLRYPKAYQEFRQAGPKLFFWNRANQLKFPEAYKRYLRKKKDRELAEKCGWPVRNGKILWTQARRKADPEGWLKYRRKVNLTTQKNYRKRHPDRVKKFVKKWSKKNPHYHRNYKRRYRKLYPEKSSYNQLKATARNREVRNATREFDPVKWKKFLNQRKIWSRKWRKKNPKRTAAISKRYIEKLRAEGGPRLEKYLERQRTKYARKKAKKFNDSKA